MSELLRPLHEEDSAPADIQAVTTTRRHLRARQSGAAALAIALVAVVGFAVVPMLGRQSTKVASPAPATSGAGGPAACPRYSEQMQTTHPGASNTLVPNGGTSVLWCRYDVVSFAKKGGHDPGFLTGTMLITERRSIDGVKDAANLAASTRGSGPHPTTGPASTERWLVVVTYPDGTRTAVDAGSAGASNGKLSGPTGFTSDAVESLMRSTQTEGEEDVVWPEPDNKTTFPIDMTVAPVKATDTSLTLRLCGPETALGVHENHDVVQVGAIGARVDGCSHPVDRTVQLKAPLGDRWVVEHFGREWLGDDRIVPVFTPKTATPTPVAAPALKECPLGRDAENLKSTHPKARETFLPAGGTAVRFCRYQFQWSSEENKDLGTRLVFEAVSSDAPATVAALDKAATGPIETIVDASGSLNFDVVIVDYPDGSQAVLSVHHHGSTNGYREGPTAFENKVGELFPRLDINNQPPTIPMTQPDLEKTHWLPMTTVGLTEASTTVTVKICGQVQELRIREGRDQVQVAAMGVWDRTCAHPETRKVQLKKPLGKRLVIDGRTRAVRPGR